MREIKFRGKATRDYPALKIKKGDWVYGYLADENLISVDIYMDDYGDLHCVLVEVYPETVGQYVSVDDKNGKEIYEGDIVRFRSGEHEGIGKIIYNPPRFEISSEFFLGGKAELIEVIGNIYENPDLLEGNDD